MSPQALLFSYFPSLIGCESADFDGTNDYMLRGAGLTGAADSKSGILSLWARFDGGDGSQLNFMSQTVANAVLVARAASGAIAIQGTNSVPTIILSIGTTGTGYVEGATWYHILSSWDLATPGSGRMYINDVSDYAETTYTDGTINYAGPDNFAVGATTAGAQKFNGCLAELYFAPGQYLDFDTAANRRKFISAAGKPIYLGVDGSLPTGTAPIIYLHTGISAAITTFATNRGTGGNFSITGTLDTGSTSPSD
jgi:hypothetical protein